MASLSNPQLEKGIRSILSSPSFDMNSETFKSIRSKLCKRLRLDQLPANKKGAFKEILTRVINEEDDEDDDDNEEEKEEQESGDDFENNVSSEKELKRKRKPSAKGKAKKKTKNKKLVKPTTSLYTSNVNSLLNLGKAMRMGPSLYKGLKELEEDEQISTLIDRLEASGASWAGKFPTSKDIQKAEVKRKRQDDLDGMDTSLIIEGGRRRRTAAVNYTSNNPLEDVENEEEKDIEKLETYRPKKEVKVKKTIPSSSEEDNKDDEDFDGDESSEAEFD